MSDFGWPLIRFILIRLLYTVLVLIGVTIAVFFLMQIVPGDPVKIALGTRYTPESYAALRSASGLDQPLFTQLIHYIGNAATGDLGVGLGRARSVDELAGHLHGQGIAPVRCVERDRRDVLGDGVLHLGHGISFV